MGGNGRRGRHCFKLAVMFASPFIPAPVWCIGALQAHLGVRTSGQPLSSAMAWPALRAQALQPPCMPAGSA